MSEFSRMVDRFDSVVDRLEELVKENPNDADLGGEVRKLVRQLIKERNTGNYE